MVYPFLLFLDFAQLGLTTLYTLLYIKIGLELANYRSIKKKEEEEEEAERLSQYTIKGVEEDKEKPPSKLSQIA